MARPRRVGVECHPAVLKPRPRPPPLATADSSSRGTDIQWRTFLDTLTIAGGLASLIGLGVSLVTLLLVSRLRPAIKKHARRKQLLEIIDRVRRIPASKETLPGSTCEEIKFVTDAALSYDLSPWPFRDRPAKRIIGKIEAKLVGGRRRQPLQHQLGLLREELAVH